MNGYFKSNSVLEQFSLKKYPYDIDESLDDHQIWTYFAELGLLRCEHGSQDLFYLIAYLSYQVNDPCQLLAALFQLSGVMLPLAIHAKDSHFLQESLAAMTKGEIIAAHCLTESEAGTDSFAMRTLAKQESRDWILNGKKTFICNANIADMGLVYAKNEKNNTSFSDLIALLIPLKQPAVQVSLPHEKLGLNKIWMGDITFNNLAFPDEAIIGHSNFGFSVLQVSTTYERIIIPLSFIGRMIKIYEKCQVVARENVEVSYYLSEMRLKIEVAVTYILAQLKNIHFLKWHRSYLSVGCCVKIYLTDAYLAVLSLSQYLFPHMSKHEKQFIINEKKSALAAWIYSGTNDSLRSMLWKLNG